VTCCLCVANIIRDRQSGSLDSGLNIPYGYKSETDGKDYPLRGSPLADSVSATRINERRGESVLKRLGNVVLGTKASISWDGKTLTVMRIGMGADGQMVDEVMVYERQ